MSKRHRRQRKSFPWVLIALGAVLVIAAIVLVANRGEKDSGTPKLVVDQELIDYGYVKFGETRAFEIAVTNSGDGVLRFKEKPYIEILEGC